jgi:hypothetical protein
LGETLGWPALSTVASQQRTLRLAASWISGESMYRFKGFVRFIRITMNKLGCWVTLAKSSL